MSSTTQTYEKFSKREFEQFLETIAPFEQVTDTRSRQIVYSISFDQLRDVDEFYQPLREKALYNSHQLEVQNNLELRVFSTIEFGTARRCGDAAIKNVLWHTKKHQPVGGMPKTLRIKTWRSNLEEKIIELIQNYDTHFSGFCPECPKGKLVRKNPDNSTPFLGCNNFPACDHTLDL